MKSNKWKTSVSYRMSAIAITMIIACSAAIGVFSFALYRNDSIDKSSYEALATARAVAASIDTEAYTEILEKNETNDYWDGLKAYLDEVKINADLEYLYVLNATDSGQLMYFAEGAKPGEDEIDNMIGFFGELDTEGAFADEAGDTLATGQETVTEIYNSEGFGMMVSGFAPVKDASGKTIAAVGADISLNDVMMSTNIFGLAIIAIAVGVSIVCGLLFSRYAKKNIGTPINQLTDASEKISVGDTDVTLNFTSEDEIGRLTNSFNRMVDSTVKQVHALETIADGDLSVTVHSRGEKDTMSHAMRKMVDNLSNMVSKINVATEQVAIGSKQVADGADVLAQGAMEQSGSVDELSRSVVEVTEITDKNSEMAVNAADLAETIMQDANEGTGQMTRMEQAVKDISDSSASIGKIIKIIDDIAFQTNILALNAAVEAARAGEHGKGFAVVADEVRNLASKSADAAQETDRLINESMEKASLGSQISSEMVESLSRIVEGIGQSTEIVKGIAEMSVKQKEDIDRIKTGIEQVANVAQQNSAAASQEMSSQAQLLGDYVKVFRIGK